MNTYGATALRYMRRHRPHALSTIVDPEMHFSTLGEEISAEIDDLEQAAAGPAPAGESYLARAGRLRMARTMATEAVLGELVYSTSEEPDAATDETGAYVGGPPGWEPLAPAEDPEATD